MANDVFISYSSIDKNAAETVCSILEKNDIGCWIAPRDITPGVPFAEAIIDAIKESKIFIIIYSSNSNQSSQVIKEVDRAVHHGLAIITLRLEDIPMSKQLEYYISNVHWLEAISSPLEQHLDQLAEVVQTLLSKKQLGDDDIEKAISDGAVKHKGSADIGKISTAKKKKLILVSGFLLIIAIVVASLLLSNIFGEGKNQEDGSIGSIIVLPFANYTGDERLETLVSGMHTCLITDIGRLGGLQVINPTTSNVYKNAGRPVHEIAEELNVEGAIEVSVLGIQDSVLFEVNLISAFPEEKTIWTGEYIEEKGKLLNLFNQVTKQIASELKIELTAEEEQLFEETRIVNPEALDAYLIGEFYWEKLGGEDIDNAIYYFEIAIEKDPDWAAPYAGLALSWMTKGGFDLGFIDDIDDDTDQKVLNTRYYLDKALELDPNSADAHYVEALIKTWGEWNYVEAEKEFERTLESNPNHALCRMYYAHMLMIQHRFDEARVQGGLALKLEPAGALILALNANLNMGFGDYQEALANCKQAFSIDPENTFNQLSLAEAYRLTGDISSWVNIMKGFWALGDTIYEAYIDEVYKGGGFLAVVKDLIKVKEEVLKEGGEVGYGGLAENYIWVDDYGKAMYYYEKAFENHENLMNYISTYYIIYPKLKDNPRYLALLKKMNLPLPKSD